MHLQNKKVHLIVILCVISLTGLVGIQLYLLSNTVELEKQAFVRSVRTAMQLVVRRLELSEAVHTVSTSGLPRVMERQIAVFQVETDSGYVQSYLMDRLNYEQYYTQVDSTGQAFLLKTEAVQQKKGPVSAQRPDLQRDSTVVTRKRQMVEQVLDRMFIVERKPVITRIIPANLDSLIRISLLDVGIDLEFAFGITRPRNRMFHFVHPMHYMDQLSESEYQTRLFPNDFLINDVGLVLHFPDQNLYLLKQVGPMLGVTLVLTAVLVICFVITLRSVTAQRRFYDRLVEFINNMTHEFKTPISTIALASEALKKNEVTSDADRLTRYSTIISEENQRMQKQVETILQFTSLEEANYELQCEPIDVHRMLYDIAESFGLQAEARNGTVTCCFHAVKTQVEADPVHLEQICRNVLDNALKYSTGSPVITIQTENVEAGLCIRITDQGIGIPPQYLPHVFDKYYRVPTGYRHDVKGFGLGLSYVKLMVDAHHAHITIDSTAGEGTTVSITWPMSSE